MFQESIEAETFLELEGVSFHGIYPLFINHLLCFGITTKRAYV